MKYPNATPEFMRLRLATGFALDVVVWLYYWTHSGHYADVVLDAPNYSIQAALAVLAATPSLTVLRLGTQPQKIMAGLLLLLPGLVVGLFAYWAISNWT